MAFDPTRRDPAFLTPQGEMESKLGVDPLEWLLAERDDLVKEIAPLRARHGSFGTWDDLRRVERSTIAMRLRAEALAESRKVTEGWLEDASQSDPAYVDFVIQGTNEKARWHELENRIQAIQDTILRANAILRYQAAEAHL